MWRTAVDGVPPGDHGGSPDIRECRQIFEEVVTLGHHAVGSIRARNCVERLCALVVYGVPGDTRGTNGEWRDK